MSKTRLDLRDALLSSPEYLADALLAQCAFIENSFYRINSDKNAEIGHVIVKVYKAILHFFNSSIYHRSTVCSKH